LVRQSESFVVWVGRQFKAGREQAKGGGG